MNFIIFIVWVAVLVLIAKKRLSLSANERNEAAKRARNFNNVPSGSDFRAPHIDKSELANPSFKQGTVLSLKDDREHDWLAQQLAEEHRAFKRTSVMFDLKYEHASSCDAKLLQSAHRANCEAGGVDTGLGK